MNTRQPRHSVAATIAPPARGCACCGAPESPDTFRFHGYQDDGDGWVFALLNCTTCEATIGEEIPRNDDCAEAAQ